MNTTELLESYYEGFARKEGWETVISDDFKFVGGDMMDRTPVTGKGGYIEVIRRFSKLFTSMKVKKMIVNGDSAFVLAGYGYVFPGNKKIKGDVAELWEVRQGKLDSLTIYFDTLTFHRLTGK